MNRQVPLTILASLALLSTSVSVSLFVNEAQATPAQSAEEAIEQTTNPQGCFWLPGFGKICV